MNCVSGGGIDARCETGKEDGKEKAKRQKAFKKREETTKTTIHISQVKKARSLNILIVLSAKKRIKNLF